MERKKLEILLLYLGIVVPLALTLFVVEKTYALLGLSLFPLTLIIRIKDRHVPSWLVNLLATLFVIIFLLSVNLENFLQTSLTTLLFLLLVKLLERITLRNLFQVYLLALLLYAGLTYYYAQFSFFILLILNLLYLPVALFLHLYLEEGKLNFISLTEIMAGSKAILLLCLLTMLMALPFFFFFPRLSAPLFQLSTEKQAKTGFTDTIKLGQFSTIHESSAKVLRLKINFPISPEEIYLRVLTYDYFDGKNWHHRIPSQEKKKIPPTKGEALTGEIYLEQPQGSYLPVPESAHLIMANFPFFSSSDYTFQTAGELYYPIRYSFVSKRSLSKPALEVDLKPYLQVPKVSPKILELAHSLKGLTEEETIKKIYQFLTSPNFSYTLKNLNLSGNPLEDFLFKSRKGNCEYFAGAMTLLLRLNGIPARMVGGYRGAIYQRVGNYYLVEERFAHAWVEVYQKGNWLVYDPTPSLGTLPYQRVSMLKKVSLYLDLLNYYYTRFILDYNLQNQKKILTFAKNIFSSFSLPKSQERVQISEIPSFLKERGAIFFFIFLCLFLIFLLFYLGKKYSLPKEKRLLKEFLKILKSLGVEKKDSHGLWEVLEKIQDPQLKELASKFVIIYGSCYYKDKTLSKEDWKTLKQLLTELKSLKIQKRSSFRPTV